ncbi:MAG TPA: cell wall-binding repeat-containing protein, partial [Nitriliruptorales bacterium]
MQRRTRRSPLVATALTLALALGTLVGLTPGGANALIPYPDTERISVSDAISAGIAISKRLYKADEAGAVILTRDDKFPDGLAASALSGDKDAPVLFTPSNRLASATRTELDRVLAAGGDVYLMGGEVALEPAVEQELKGAGYRTIRIGGDDRVNTAANAAQFFVGAGPGRTAILVRARGDAGKDETQGWPDAIACGGYAANTQTPVVLTNPRADSLPQATVDALNGMDIDRVIICGGPNAVPADHAGQLVQMGITVSRYAGDTRVTTAIDVARRLWNKGVSTDGDHFILVNGWGTNFAYGIAAAPLSGDRAAPVLIVNTDDPDTWPVDCSNLPTNSAATLCYLNGDGDDRVGSLTLIGATSVVTDAVFEAAARAGGIPKDTKPPTVPAGVAAADTPEDDGKHLDVTWEASTDASGGAITYTVYVREASDDELTTANSTKAGTVTGKTALTIGGLTAGTDYETAVTASDRFGNTSKLSPKSNVATPTDEIPAAPASAPNVQNQPGPKIVVSWIEAPEKDAAAYIVERANPSSFTDCDASPIMVGGPSFEVIGESKPKTNTSFTDDTVETGEAYCYRYRIKDTTGNQTAPSDPVAVEATDASEDNTPPPGTPQLYAVNFDQTEGLIGGGSAASRTEKPQTRLDVIVPSGAFSNGETGHVIVFVGGSERHDETFAATGSEQIVSAPVSLNNDENDSTLEFTVRLADAAGNRGNVSAGWSTEFDRLLPAVPRIVAVDGVNTDPLNFANARIPVVGDDTPRVDPTPLITVGGLSTSSAFAQRVTLWHNGLVAAQSRCFASGSVPSNGQVRFNDPSDPESPEVTMLTGTNTLVVTLEQRTASNCGGTVVGRAGDSNTVRYVFNASSFGILTSTPLHGADDVFAFQDLDEFTVTLNKPAAAGATLALRRAGTTTNVASTTAGSASDTLTLAKPASFGPGGWELVVNATASDDS